MATEFHDQAFTEDARSNVPLPAAEGPGSTSARRISLLARSELGAGLQPLDLESIANLLSEREVEAGAAICRHHEPGDCAFLIAEGRVRVSLERSNGSYGLVDELTAGDHFGEMSVLTDTPRAITATALTAVRLYEIPKPAFHELMQSVPGFAANLSRSLGYHVRWQRRQRRPRRWPRVVGLVRTTLSTHQVLRPLCAALAERGEQIEIVTDRSRPPTFGDGVRAWSTAADDDDRDDRKADPNDRNGFAAPIEARKHQCDRLFVEMHQNHSDRSLLEALSPCEEVWWLVDPKGQDSAWCRLREILQTEPRLAARIHIVWVLTPESRIAPLAPSDLTLAKPDFKAVLSSSVESPCRQMQHSISRLVNQLRRSRIGLALSGGGARGMAHLGVLRELEAAGIYFDLIAGTSIGALMGLSYAGGWEPAEALERFRTTLTPPRFVRWLPGGTHGYLAAMYRSGAWNRRLRPYLGEARLEQFPTPLSTVAVDLVSGTEVVRSSGDSIDAVLESINLPIISRPILRDGQVLVDGGVLNNLPAEVLPAQGAHFVLGVDVVARLAPVFAGNRPSTPSAAMRLPGPGQLLVRINEVQDQGLARLRQRPLDFVIAPETAEFEFADFSAANELADAGAKAAEQALAELRQQLATLDSAA